MYTDAVLNVFSQRYPDAREKFMSATEMSSIVDKVNSHQHMLKGPRGEKLFCDIAWAGNPNAKQVLVLVSGLHGVEGGVGSAIQSDFLTRHRRLPADLCVVLVHALNPWGLAWASRSDHEGIDVNRNFVDFSAPLPTSTSANIWKTLIDKKVDINTVGSDRQQFDLLSEGQYDDPSALYFGGKQASWSRQCIEQLAGQLHLREREQVIVIDLHSGLGPYGYGEIISDHPVSSPARNTVMDVFGASVTEPALGTSSSGLKQGLHDYFWHAQGDHVSFVTLEFGTFSNSEMLRVLFADHQLQQQKISWQDEKTREIKYAMQDFFCPDEKRWQELVLFRGRQVIEMALNGLTSSNGLDGNVNN
jgi:predicted deacylase